MATKKQYQRNSDTVQSLKEFFAGCVGGWSQVIVGQPFDIVKVRLQTQDPLKPEYSGFLDAVKKIAAREGPLAFYKGSVAPLLGVGAAVSIQFGVVEHTKRFFQNLTKTVGELPMQYVFWSGCVAGLANSIVSISAEHIRIRMQVQGLPLPGKTLEYSGSLDCVKKIYGKHGIRGIYKGTNITLIREFLSYGAYFYAYEYMLRTLRKPGQQKKDIAMWKLMLAGATAGYAYWISVYPIDVIKTKLQTDSFANPRYNGSLDCLRQTLKADGLGGLFKGFTPCMLRAGPTNATGFIVFEQTLRMLGSNSDIPDHIPFE